LTRKQNAPDCLGPGGQLRISVEGKEDDLGLGTVGLDPLGGLHPVDIRHSKVHQHDIPHRLLGDRRG
jgi:hypothetical protein